MRGKKEMVLETAAELFFRQGITGTSMDEIAEAVPVSKMTLYNHFRSKERLLEQVLERYMENRIEAAKRIFDNAEDPWQAILQMNREETGHTLSDAFVRDLIAGYPELSAKLVGLQKDFLGAELEKLIFRCQQEGMIRKNVSPHVILLMILALKEYFAKPEVWTNAGDIYSLSEQLMTVLYHGMMTDEYKRKQ